MHFVVIMWLAIGFLCAGVFLYYEDEKPAQARTEFLYVFLVALALVIGWPAVLILVPFVLIDEYLWRKGC